MDDHFDLIEHNNIGSLFIKKNNKLYAVGENQSGQLGIGSRDQYIYDYTLVNVPSNIKKIVCGAYNTFIITIDNKLYACGDNYDNLGFNSSAKIDTFTQVTALPSDLIIENIYCGPQVTFLAGSGKLYCCGNNIDGELGLGNNNTVSLFTECAVKFDPDDIVSMDFIDGSSYVLLTDGSVYATGSNAFSQLPIRGLLSGSINKFTEASLNNIKKIYTHNSFFIAIDNANNMFACGKYVDGKTKNLHQISTPATDIFSVARSRIFFILEPGKILALGNNKNGVLGIGSGKNATYESDIINVPTTVKQITGTLSYTLYLLDSGELFLAGLNKFDTLKNINNNMIKLITNVKKIVGSGKILQMEDNSYYHNMSSGVQPIKFSGGFTPAPEPLPPMPHLVRTPGLIPRAQNNENPLPVPPKNQLPVPQLLRTPGQAAHVLPTSSTEIKIKQMYSNGFSTFILLTDGTLRATGQNKNGELGLGDNIPRIKFVRVNLNFNHKVTKMILSDTASYIFTEVGTIYACGLNTYGQLGIGNTSNMNEFMFVRTVTNIDTTKLFCTSDRMFMAYDNELHSCGNNYNGKLGFGNNEFSSFLRPNNFFDGKKVVNIAFGTNSTYVLLSDNTVAVTGDNTYKQLALLDPSPMNKLNFELSSLTNVQSIAVHDNSFYAIVGNKKELWVCGNNENGQLGIKNKNFATTLVKTSMKNVRKIVPSSGHALMIDGYHNVWGTGNNDSLKLGLSDSEYKYFTKTSMNDAKLIVSNPDNDKSYIVKRDNVLYVSEYGAFTKFDPEILVKNIDKVGMYIETIDGDILKYDNILMTFNKIPFTAGPVYVPINYTNMLYSLNKNINFKLIDAIEETININEQTGIKVLEIKYLSEGTFGIGYKVTLTNKTHIFVKKPTSHVDAYKFLKQEFKVLTKFTHPNIIDEKYLIDFTDSNISYTTNTDHKGFLQTVHHQTPKMCIMITELYEGTIDKLGKEHWLNPMNTLNFISVMSHALFYLNEHGFVHKDIKEANIMYTKKDGNTYYKLIDFGLSTELLEKSDTYKYNALYRRSGTANYMSSDTIETDKIDVYALGITLLRLIKPSLFLSSLHFNELYKNIIKKNHALTIISRINFTSNPDIPQGSFALSELILKKLMYNMVRDTNKRSSSFNVMNQISFGMINLMDSVVIDKFKEYITANFRLLPLFSKQIDEHNLDFLYEPYISLFTNYSSYSIKKLCLSRVEQAKKLGHGADLSDLSMKYIFCNYIGFEDDISESGTNLLDMNRSIVENMLKQNILLNKINLNIHHNVREMILINDTTLNHLMDHFLDQNSEYNKINSSDSDYEMKRINIVADYVYYNLTNHTYSKYTGDDSLGNKIIRNETTNKQNQLYIPKKTINDKIVDIIEFINMKDGVCRHRSLLFKYFCDKLKIKCKIIRGFYNRSVIDIESKHGAHVWNVVEVKGKLVNIDIMLPNGTETRNREQRPTYVIPPSQLLYYTIGEHASGFNLPEHINKIRYPINNDDIF